MFPPKPALRGEFPMCFLSFSHLFNSCTVDVPIRSSISSGNSPIFLGPLPTLTDSLPGPGSNDQGLAARSGADADAFLAGKVIDITRLFDHIFSPEERITWITIVI